MANNANALIEKIRKIKDLTSENSTYLSNRLRNFMLDVVRDRIFVRGLSSLMTPIGTYSERRFNVYEPDAGFTEFVANRKGDTKWADESVWSSSYLPFSKHSKKYNKLFAYEPQGTKGFREAQKLVTAYVNLDYTGALKDSLVSRAQGNIIAIEIKSNVNMTKMNWLENHYNVSIFALSPSEVSLIKSQVARQIRLLIRETLY